MGPVNRVVSPEESIARVRIQEHETVEASIVIDRKGQYERKDNYPRNHKGNNPSFFRSPPEPEE